MIGKIEVYQHNTKSILVWMDCYLYDDVLDERKYLLWINL